MNNVKKQVCLLAFAALSISTFAQSTATAAHNFIRDVNGRYIDLKPSIEVQGSPYAFDNYLDARLTYKTRAYLIKAKLNLADNTVLFKNEETEMISSVPIDKIEFYNEKTNKYDLVYKNGFPSIGKNTALTYYNVLDSGKATLLKQISIRQRETRPYNTATNLTIYEKDKSYYVALKGMMLAAKKMDELAAFLNDHHTEVEQFISANKLKINKEEDLRKLISFYNSLK